MYIITVSPLKSIKGFEKITYFSKEPYQFGDIIKAPFRQKEIWVAVDEVKELSDIKMDVKNKSFTPKKIKKQKALKIFSAPFIKACRSLADHCATSLGLVLANHVPSAILQNPDKYAKALGEPQKDDAAKKTSENNKKENLRPKLSIMCAPQEERIEQYKSSVRAYLARGKNVFIICPNIKSAEELTKHISQGIEKMVKLVNCDSSPKKCIENFAANSKAQAKCLIGTASLLALRANFDLLIIEKENSSSYVKLAKPYCDSRVLAEKLASMAGAELVLADIFPRLESYQKYFEDKAMPLGVLPQKLRNGKKLKVLNIKEEIIRAKAAKRPYPVLSQKILSEVEKRLAREDKIFILAQRKGLASSIVCLDCTATVKCPACKANIKAHKDGKEVKFLCHRCGFSMQSNIRCPSCESWKLKAYGISDEGIEEFLKSEFGAKLKIASLHRCGEKRAREVIEKFANDDLQILVGTEFALRRLKANSVPYVVVANPDSLMSVANFKMEEKIFYLLSEAFEISSEKLEVQVKDENLSSIKFFKERSIMDFVRHELKLREKLGWPPYSLIIKITAHGKSKKEVIKNMQSFVNAFSKFKPRIFQEFITDSKGEYKLNALIKTKAQNWPEREKELLEQIRILPSCFTVKINPENILD